MPFDQTSEAPRGQSWLNVRRNQKCKSEEKLRRAKAATRGKARRAKAAKATKRTVAKAKPKRAPVKKVARKTVAPVVETAVVEVVEQPAPGITVTEVEETEIRKAS